MKKTEVRIKLEDLQLLCLGVDYQLSCEDLPIADMVGSLSCKMQEKFSFDTCEVREKFRKKLNIKFPLTGD